MRNINNHKRLTVMIIIMVVQSKNNRLLFEQHGDSWVMAIVKDQLEQEFQFSGRDFDQQNAGS